MELLRKYSKSHFSQRVIAYFLMCSIFLNTSLPVALAGPEGAQVVNGQVSFQQSGNNTTITASDKAIINYTSFDIARLEAVRFIQPDSSASVLNRILSANPTNINGALLANGRVFFVNSAGVYIGAGARINVNQLVVSSLNITDSDFINGQYNFAGGDGSVINSGDISAKKVYLIGKQVANSGSIHCPDGYVVMAAGDRVFLSEPGSDVRAEIDPQTLSDPTDLADSGSGVPNEGTVNSAGGRIVLASGDIYSQVIPNIDYLAASIEIGNTGQVSNTGTIEARSETASGGSVIAKAAEVINSGTIDVTGSEGGEVTIEATGRLGQLGIIHADGTTGNGGNVELRADNVVTLSADSLTTANAGTNGDGGEVVVYSPDTALFHDGAAIEAKGGTESGNGGFIEVSGKKHVEVFGQVDASADVGEPGTFLIDPTNVTIQDCAGAIDPGSDGAFTPSCNASTISDDAIEEWLNNGINVEINVAYDDTKRGNITQDADAQIEKTSGGDATIKLAAHDITLEGGIDSKSGKLGLILDADGDVVLRADIATNGGDFTSSGDQFDNTDGLINTIDGAVKIEHLGEVKIGRIDAREGDVAISAGAISEGESDSEVDIEGSVVNLEAQSGAIGPLDVTASKQLNAKTLKDNADIIISSPVELPCSCNPTEVRDLVIGVVDSAGVVNIRAVGGITVAGGEGEEISAKTNINLHAGENGTGDLSFQPEATLQAPEIELRAGDGLDFVYDLLEEYMDPACLIPDEDGLGGNGKNSKVNLTNLEVIGNKKLTIRQDKSIAAVPANMQFEPDGAAVIDLHMQSDDGSITCTSAHEWGSISASAYEYITLQGSGKITTGNLKTRTGNISVRSTGGDLVINGKIDAYWRGMGEVYGDDENCPLGYFDPGKIFSYKNIPGGGVELVADAGKIYSGNAGTLNVSITGYSDDLWATEPVGVELPGGTGRAGIVITSRDSLHLGPEAVLTTCRKSKGGEVIRSDKDDRDGVYFLSGPSSYDRAGDPFDVSVYLASTGRDVIVDSKVRILDDGGGGMVVDAKDKVDFGCLFAENWVTYGFPRLEVVSRTTQTPDQAATYETMPGAREMLEGKVPTWIMEAANQQIASGNEPDKNASDDHWSKYVLRGGTPGQVLTFVELTVGPPGQWFDIAKASKSAAAHIKEWYEYNRDIAAQEQARRERNAQNERVPSPFEPTGNIAEREQTGRDRNSQNERVPPLLEPMLLSISVRRGTKQLRANPETATTLLKDDIVETPGSMLGLLKCSKDLAIIIEPNTRIKIGIQDVFLLDGKIWFWTIGAALNRPFEIRTNDGHVIRITGSAKGCVHVIEEVAGRAESVKTGKTVIIGPVLDGHLFVYGPDMRPEGLLNGRGEKTILESGAFRFKQVTNPDLDQESAEFNARLDEAPGSILVDCIGGSWPRLFALDMGVRI